MKRQSLPAFGVVFILIASSAWAQDLWPDLSSPPKATGGGEKDAAVIIGAENYAFVAKVPGARRNAEDWQAYLTETLKVPSERVALLRDNEATDAKMRRFATQAASAVGEGGTLWFIFIGHGAPAKDGTDGLLVGTDAQQDPDGLYSRSLPRNELLGLLSKGGQAKTVVLLDACFSGRSPTGEVLMAGLQPLVLVGNPSLGVDPRTVLLTAAKSDQFAGPLPKSDQIRPAFSYLALGALRGWAADAKGQVTASGLIDFARRALTLEKGRTQTPELTAGSTKTILSRGLERGPELSRIDRESKPQGSAAPVAGNEYESAVAEMISERKKSVQGVLKGISLGDSLKKLKESDSAWKMSDPKIDALGTGKPPDENAPVRIYSMMSSLDRKKPIIEVLGDDPDINYAKAIGIRLAYINYDKRGIKKEDFLGEMKAKWGQPDQSSSKNGVDEYWWINTVQGISGHLIFSVSTWGPVVNVTLQRLKYGTKDQRSIDEWIKATNKARDILE